MWGSIWLFIHFLMNNEPCPWHLHLAVSRFRSLRASHVALLVKNPKAKPRHEKLDIDLFTKSKEEDYVDVKQETGGPGGYKLTGIEIVTASFSSYHFFISYTCYMLHFHLLNQFVFIKKLLPYHIIFQLSFIICRQVISHISFFINHIKLHHSIILHYHCIMGLSCRNFWFLIDHLSPSWLLGTILYYFYNTKIL